MKRISAILVALFAAGIIKAQFTDSSAIIRLNQQIDNYVTEQNLAALDTLYADDFVFAHGSGRVEGKNGWLKTVSRVRYPRRLHDSVTAEWHPEAVIVKGSLSIQRIDKDRTARYRLRYIRLFVLREKRWQLASHHTVYEHHEL